MTPYRPQNHLKDTRSLMDIQRASRPIKTLAHKQLFYDVININIASIYSKY